MNKYLKLEDAIRSNITNIKKKSKFSVESSGKYANTLISLKNKLKLHILETEELKNDPTFVTRYREIKNDIELALQRMKQPSLDETKGVEITVESEDNSGIESDPDDEIDDMTSILEIIKIASTLIPEFDGSYEKLNRVVSAIQALQALVTDVNKASAIQVILSKLSGKARSAVPENPLELQEIIDALNSKCATTQTPELLLAKIAGEKQSGELAKFTDQLEKLTLQLENAYIAEKVPAVTAARLATRAGTNALANGLKCKETQLIVKAGKFDTFAEAVAKAIENDKTPPSNTVLYYRAPSSNQFRGGYRGRNARGNILRGGGQYNGRNHGYQNNYQTRGRGRYAYQNSHSNRGGNNFRGGNHHQHSRVFYAQPENQPNPQSQSVGGPQQNQQAPQHNTQVALANLTRR